MAYVKCNYYDGMFSSEYFVNFGDKVEYSSPLGGMFVNKEDIIPCKEKEFTGLVKATLQEFSQDKALVDINDVGEHKRSRLWVPKDQILIDIDEARIVMVLSMDYRHRHG